jgi:hypothetical protein
LDVKLARVLGSNKVVGGGVDFLMRQRLRVFTIQKGRATN